MTLNPTQLSWFKENFVEVVFDETEDQEYCDKLEALLVDKNEDAVFDIIAEVFSVQDAVDMRSTASLT